MMKTTNNRLPDRRGSVLIFVIGILVLLALMGTAYVAAVRLDKIQVSGIGGTGANSGGWMMPPSAAMSAAEDYVIGTGTTPPNTSIKYRLVKDLFGTGYRVGAGYQNSDTTVAASPDDFWLADRMPDPDLATPIWHTISRSIVTGSATFASPYAPGADIFDTFEDLTPTSITLPVSTGTAPLALQGKTRVYPALTDGTNVWLAADTDGDGIADAAFVDLSLVDPVKYTFDQRHQQPDGSYITRPAANNHIFAAIRVIDNNAAINLNTAWSLTDSAFLGGTKPNYGWFRSNVGLIELMSDPTAFNTWRIGWLNNTFGTTRAEALEMQLGRRMQGTSYIDEADTASLVYHGGMVDPDRSTPNSAEGHLLNDLYYSAANFAYDSSKRFRYFPADKVDEWFRASFKIAAAPDRDYLGYRPPYVPQRMYVVSSNPLSNLMPALYAGANQPLVPETPAPPAGYETMKGYTFAAPYTSSHPAKVGINTADFGHLWTAFWNVMADPANPTVAADPAALGTGNSPLRAGLTALTARDILELRSALAAVNAEDMRDTDENLTGHVFRLSSGNYDIQVFGSEKQPFFKQVDGEVGTNNFYVTLYNPYDATFDASGFKFAYYNYTTGTITDLGAVTGPAIPIRGWSVAPITVPFPTAAPYSGALLLMRPQVLGAGGGIDTWVAVDSVDLSSYDPAALPNPMISYKRDVTNWRCADNRGTFKAGTTTAYDNNISFPVGLSNTPAANTVYPFGGFPRVGDIMLVPYAGSYKVYNTSNALQDLVAVTRDVTKVGAAAPGEMIGRFVPVDSTKFQARIFDVFSVITNPSDDKLPNIATGADVPENGGLADDKPVHGLININTAPEKVLELLPIVATAGAGTIDQGATTNAAKDIIAKRGSGNPFTSILDLKTRSVTSFTVNPANLTTSDGNFLPTQDVGVFTPFLEWHNVNRISNVATTRSDSFTVYVLIQAWQDAGSIDPANPPVLVAEKRTAFIIDRSQVTTPTDYAKLKITDVKTE